VRQINLLCVVLLLLTLAACAKHDAGQLSFLPITTFSGRLLVIDQKHRFQVEIDWQAEEKQGKLRLTHALSGRVVHVTWQDEKMFWHDNAQNISWEPLSRQALLDMGVILPPWVLAKVFLGDYPSTMHSKDNRLWKGRWGSNELKIKWASEQQRVELVDFKQGKRAVVIFN
jgi:hypothetical protein